MKTTKTISVALVIVILLSVMLVINYHVLCVLAHNGLKWTYYAYYSLIIIAYGLGWVLSRCIKWSALSGKYILAWCIITILLGVVIWQEAIQWFIVIPYRIHLSVPVLTGLCILHGVILGRWKCYKDNA